MTSGNYRVPFNRIPCFHVGEKGKNAIQKLNLEVPWRESVIAGGQLLPRPRPEGEQSRAMNGKPYLTIDQAAAFLGCDKKRVRLYCRYRQLAHHKLSPRHYLFTEVDLVDFIERRKVEVQWDPTGDEIGKVGGSASQTRKRERDSNASAEEPKQKQTIRLEKYRVN